MSRCLCAGPYGHRLLGISSQAALSIESELLKKKEILRPGYVRVSFAYEMTDEDVDYIISAVEFVAQHGYRLLNDYIFYVDGGQ